MKRDEESATTNGQRAMTKHRLWPAACDDRRVSVAVTEADMGKFRRLRDGIFFYSLRGSWGTAR
jgi:hypothetical protein